MEQEDEIEQCFTMQQKLIEVGNSFWDHNWSWTVTKQEIDYGDEKDNKMEVAVATFIRVIDKSGMHRENMGYSFISKTEKGFAYCLARKVSIVNALLETLHSFGGEISKKLNSLELNGYSINYNKTKMELISKQRHEQKVFNDNKNDNQRTNASPVNQGNYSNSNSSNSSSRINKQCQALQPCNKSQETAPNQKSNSVYGKPRRTVPVISSATAVAPAIPNNRPVSGPHLASNSTNVFPIAPQAPIVFGVPPTNPVPVTMPPAPSGPQISRQIPNNEAQNPVKKTEAELREERKRRQREKQEEFQRKMNTNAHNALGIQNEDENNIVSPDPSFVFSTQDFNTVINGMGPQVPPWMSTKLKRPSSGENMFNGINKKKFEA